MGKTKVYTALVKVELGPTVYEAGQQIAEAVLLEHQSREQIKALVSAEAIKEEK